jgi:hypothetical protein
MNRDSLRLWRASAAGIISRVSALLRATLREIFDENAYDRFLSRRGLVTSRDSYAAFLRESHAERTRRPRCC